MGDQNCWEHWLILLLFESWKKDFKKSGLDWNEYLSYIDALNLDKEYSIVDADDFCSYGERKKDG